MTSSRKVHRHKHHEENAFQRNGAVASSLNLGLDAAAAGNLLYHIHSTYFKPILFAKEETSLQFYDHVGECGLGTQ